MRQGVRWEGNLPSCMLPLCASLREASCLLQHAILCKRWRRFTSLSRHLSNSSYNVISSQLIVPFRAHSEGKKSNLSPPFVCLVKLCRVSSVRTFHSLSLFSFPSPFPPPLALFLLFSLPLLPSMHPCYRLVLTARARVIVCCCVSALQLALPPLACCACASSVCLVCCLRLRCHKAR